MAREIIWGINKYGETALPADEFVRQREALNAKVAEFPNPSRSLGTNAGGAQRFTDGSYSAELGDAGKPAPLKITVLKVAAS